MILFPQAGWVIWFTALFPYFVMITLLIKALTLEGASEGLKAYTSVSIKKPFPGKSYLESQPLIIP